MEYLLSGPSYWERDRGPYSTDALLYHSSYDPPSFSAHAVSSSISDTLPSQQVLDLSSHNLTINIPKVKPVNGFSVDFWMKTSLPATETVLIDQACPTPLKVSLDAASNLIWYVTTSSIQNAITPNTWERILLFVISELYTSQLFVGANGVQIENNEFYFCSEDVIKLNPTSSPITIKITNFKIRSRGLSSNEAVYTTFRQIFIYLFYFRKPDPNDPHFLLYFPFLELPSSKFADSSTFGSLIPSVLDPSYYSPDVTTGQCSVEDEEPTPACQSMKEF